MTTPDPFAGSGAFRLEARRFVVDEIAPIAARCERHARFPRAAIRACGKRGYLALDQIQSAVLAEELARCDSLGVALSIFVQAGLIGPLLRQLATGARQHADLGALQAGRLVAAMAVSEPHAGSDFAAITCRATRKGRGFIVDGDKTYISAAAAADVAVVAARIDGDGPPGLSLFLIPLTAPGVRVTRLDTLGLATSAMAAIAFRRCRVPADALIGERGAAYGYIQDALNRERLYGGIGAIAWAQRAVDHTTAFLRSRRAFGRTLGRFQAIRHQMADLATTVEAARQLNYATFERWRTGQRVTKEIAMIKLFSYRAAQHAVETCLQLHGGLGYMADHWTSRWFRDARALTIAAGTPEVMRDLIAAHLRL
jgi:acyl-CoA dehydrogenase